MMLVIEYLKNKKKQKKVNKSFYLFSFVTGQSLIMLLPESFEIIVLFEVLILDFRFMNPFEYLRN